MLVDLRCYTYHHHQFYEFLALYKEKGFPLTTKHLGTTMSIATSASGIANQTFQFFCYDDHDHRDQCRFGLRSDSEWLEYVKSASPMIAKQHNTLMVTTPNCPIQAPEDIKNVWLNREGGVPEAEVLEYSEISCKPGQIMSVLQLIDEEFAPCVADYSNRPVLRFVTKSDRLDRVILLTSFERLQKVQELRTAEWTDKSIAGILARMSDSVVDRFSRLISPVPYAN